MMKRVSTNLLLLAVLIVLLLLLFYEPGLERPVAPQRLLSLSAEEVDTIAINHSMQQRVVLKRDPEAGWRMIEPLQVAANPYKVESVLDILQQQPTNRFAIDHSKLELYGLQQPQVELKFNDRKPLRFGSQTPLNAYRYLEIGEEIVTINDSAFYPVASRYTNFIASRLLPEGLQIGSIQLPDFSVRFREGSWGVELHGEDHSGGLPPTADQLAQWVDGWRYASSVDIEPMDGAQATGAQDEIVITLQSGEVLHWTILDQQDGLVVGRPELGIQYHLSDSQREQLLSPPRGGPPEGPQESR